MMTPFMSEILERKKKKNPENQTLQKDLAVSEHNQKVSSSREMYLNIPEKYVV